VKGGMKGLLECDGTIRRDPESRRKN